MAWLRLDDKFGQHPKILALTDYQFRLHVTVLCYCAEYKTDGIVPQSARKSLGITPRIEATFVALKLWTRDKDGSIKVNDWRVYNPVDPTSAARKARFKERHENGEGTDEERSQERSSRAGTRARSRPVPSSSHSAADVALDADAVRQLLESDLPAALRALGWSTEQVMEGERHAGRAHAAAARALSDPEARNVGGLAWSLYTSGSPIATPMTPLEASANMRSMVNAPARFDGSKLRYLAGARAVWDATPDVDEREHRARVYLEGFTGDVAEIDAHIGALAEPEAKAA